ncbi:PIG-L deacetylase family protein [Mangrovihabitans endophyticus]|uniref:PIG-L domain-containing protein n=1 Tax=Mangrovihabitans endophyticus TaxID=1751298 RepID=A0A8J3FL19_9ACTN|nr:PIG-L deacetylase family protein [Mangrovihabitans endophyticus]GGK75754.1 PIG-L domain-containing protein [Mangrovihabitans endophyticus]
MARRDLPPMTGVLVVAAHPDDESFGLGAVIGALGERGIPVTVLCFTHGEASTLHGVRGDLGAIRSRELTAAGAALGVRGLDLRAYPDGKLSEAPLAELTAHVRRLVDAVHPSHLLAFDPNGVTGHPDHRRASEAALAAADAVGLPLLAWAIPQRVAARLNAEFGTAFAGRSDRDLPIVLAVSRHLQRRAIACHRSQSTENPVLRRRLRLLGGQEYLMLIAPPGR